MAETAAFNVPRSRVEQLGKLLISVLGLAWISGACTDGRVPRPSQRLNGLGAGIDGLEFRVFAIDETVTDRSNVRVGYLLYNAAAIDTVPLGPQSVGFEVFGPDGSRLIREALWNPEAVIAGQVVELQPRGFAGSVVNLACAEVPRAVEENCMWKYAFAQPGQYTVVAKYRMTPPPESSIPALVFDDTTVVVIQ